MQRRLHVALLIETSKSYGRGILRGIGQWVREHERWSMFVEPRALTSLPPPWLARWKGDGIIARIADPRIARAVLRPHLPTINLSAALPELEVPSLLSTPHTQCELAVQHFVERGFTSFGFCADYAHFRVWSRTIGALFVDRLKQAGHNCDIFPAGKRRAQELSWEQEQAQLVRWLKALKKPAGVLAINDSRGQQVLDACREAELTVPGDVAVLGMENDELLCTLTNPPLSSIALNAEQVGYEAAALLNRLMDGVPPPRRVVHVEPLGIVTRQSTDVTAHSDPVVARAIQFIRDRASSGVNVADVIAQARVSRSTLDRRFQDAIGRTPHEEIVRVQLEYVAQLITQTRLSLSRVAEKAGFQHAEYMGVVFRKKFGMTPGQYRRLHGQR